MASADELGAYRKVKAENERLKEDMGRRTSGPMGTDHTEAAWEPRVSRLEMGFCAAFVLIFAAIITSYLMLAGKIDDGSDRLANTTVAISELRGDMKVLNERTVNIDKKLDAISAKLDAK